MRDLPPDHRDEDPEYGYEYEQPMALQRLESMVRAASAYVQPTDDLRPSALEAARDACQQKRVSRYLGSLAILVVLATVTRFPVFLFSSQAGLIAMQSADMHRRAARSVVENGSEPNWALVEVYRAVRDKQAARLRQAD